MTQPMMREARERYHIAKLSLFNVRLLHAIGRDQRSAVRDLLDAQIRENGFRESPSTVHQGTFLQFAYICVVWLWESAKHASLEVELLAGLPGALEPFAVSLPTDHEIVGERKLNDWQSVLRLVRNALSHGNVEITEEHFVFRDQDKFRKPPESAPTELYLKWAHLAALSEACIHTLTPLLWPPDEHPPAGSGEST